MGDITEMIRASRPEPGTVRPVDTERLFATARRQAIVRRTVAAAGAAVGAAGVAVAIAGLPGTGVSGMRVDPLAGSQDEHATADPEAVDAPRSDPEVAADGSVAVADGSSFGVEWSLRARRHPHGVVCLDLDDGSGGTGTQCTAPVEPSGIRFGSSQAGEQTPVFVLGQVGKKVESVDVNLARGEPVQAEIFEVDGFPVNAYVAVLPPGSRPTEVVARNRFGLKIASSS